MVEHDEERLESIYPDGIPETVRSMMERIQRIRHAHIQVGPLGGDALALLCVIAERFPIVLQDWPQESKIESDHQEDDEPNLITPFNSEPVNWFATKNGIEVVCRTAGGHIRGEKVGIFRKGPDKGKLKIKLATSSNEFDVFESSRVSIPQEMPVEDQDS